MISALTAWMALHNYSTAQAAKAIGIGYGNLANVLRGAKPSFATARMIAAAIGQEPLQVFLSTGIILPTDSRVLEFYNRASRNNNIDLVAAALVLSEVAEEEEEDYERLL